MAYSIEQFRAHLVEAFERDVRIIGNTTQGEIVQAVDAVCSQLAMLTAENARHAERNRKALELLGITYPGLCNDEVWGGGIVEGIEALKKQLDTALADNARLKAGSGAENTITLNNYQRDNLLWLVRCAGRLHLDTGDWFKEVRYALEAIGGDPDNANWPRLMTEAHVIGIKDLTAERDAAVAERDELIRLRQAGDDDREQRLTDLTSQRDAAVAERDVLARECDRLRHGNTIEGDFVCPNALAATNAHAELTKAREEVERLRKQNDHWADCATNRGGTACDMGPECGLRPETRAEMRTLTAERDAAVAAHAKLRADTEKRWDYPSAVEATTAEAIACWLDAEAVHMRVHGADDTARVAELFAADIRAGAWRKEEA